MGETLSIRKPNSAHLDTSLVRRLVAGQFPEWAGLPVRPVEFDGWDNTTFRLGNDMSVRLPSHEVYVPQVEKEHTWLPLLAPSLPLPIPVPLAKGDPTDEFAYPWSVRRWIDGEIAGRGEHATAEPAAHIGDLTAFASELGAFLVALRRIDPASGPPAGPHSFWRGGPLAIYDIETRQTIADLGDRIDVDAVTKVWEAALDATWQAKPVWVHGDVAPTNLLVRDGRLCAVIDFGCSAVGDPACDLVMAWTFFTEQTRGAFRAALSLDAATWARGRGWALWKALLVLNRAVQHEDGKELDVRTGQDPHRARRARRVLDEVLADHSSPQQTFA